MKQYKYLYRTRFKIINLPDQDDHVEVKDFDNIYLFISKAYAEQEFSSRRKMIEEGKLLSKITDPLYDQVSFYLEMFIMKLPGEKEFFLRSLDSRNEENENLEKILISREVHSARREAIRGYLRHSVAVSEKYTLKLKVTESMNGTIKAPEITEFDIKKYGDFKNALDLAEYHISWYEEPRLQSYFPEHNEILLIELLLVEQKGKKEVETLLQHNLNHFPLGEGLKTELEDASYLEHLSRYYGHKKPSYGKKPILWDELPKQKKYELEDYDTLFDAISVWREIGFYYVVYCGKTFKKPAQKRTFINHDLTQARLAATDFFDDVLEKLDPSEAVTLIMGSTHSDMAPHVLRTTDSNLNSKTIKGCNGEKEIFASLGITPFTQDK